MSRKGNNSLYVKPRSDNQENYLLALAENDIVVCEGPPGSGKTFLAVYQALKKLRDGDIEKIVITRPLVNAGEEPGYLPGPLEEKAHPYLRPLYDNFLEFMSKEDLDKMMDHGIIEIELLAYIKGRTFKRTYMILDEAQNCSEAQIEMYMTRIGLGSKMAICGDPTQTDIDGHNGLDLCVQALHGTPDLEIVQLTETDIVRHKIISHVIQRFRRHREARSQHRRNGNGHHHENASQSRSPSHQGRLGHYAQRPSDQ